MTPERWQQVQTLFAEARTLTPDAQQRFHTMHAADTVLREEVLSMLAMDREASAFLDAKAQLPSPVPATLPERIGDYRILDLIGWGGMGIVYRAEPTSGYVKQDVALKVLRDSLRDPSAQQRFRLEHDVLSVLHPPHIARRHAWGTTDDGRPYMAMEYVEGVPLHTYVEDHNPSLEQRLDLLRQITDAVAYAHGQLVLHRDLKPRNILDSAAGQVKLLHFGLAKLLDDEVPSPGLTQTQHA